jgi:PHS family inorganic phosphate transporter-like MFS transporter
VAALVGLIVVAAYKSALLKDSPATNDHVDYMWRLLIGLGCLPGAVALYFRLTIPETPRFTMDIQRNIDQASKDVEAFLTSGSYYVDPDAVVTRVEAPKATRRDFMAYYSKWANFKVLFGCAYSWFALDVSFFLLLPHHRSTNSPWPLQIAFYGLGLNSSIVLQAIGFAGADGAKGTLGVYNTLKNVCIGNLILSAAGLIPGYWATFLFIDSWGRKPIQLMGFIMLTIIFCCMGFGYDKMVHGGDGPQAAFVFLYCLANFFQNFGPNTTTFVIPGEAFPTRYRSTSHGISAASGKLGAIVAQVGFARLKDIGGKAGSNAFVKHMYVRHLCLPLFSS